jgi:sialic acid synthase SpsE
MLPFSIAGRPIGPAHPPLVIAEIGINHEGDVEKAVRMIDDAAAVGCECVKFQTHVVEDEMVPNAVVPANARESIWDIMSRCALSEDQEARLKGLQNRLGRVQPLSARRAHRPIRQTGHSQHRLDILLRLKATDS